MTTIIKLNMDTRLVSRIRSRASLRKMTVEKMLEKQIEALFKEDDEVAPEVMELAGTLKKLKMKNAKKEFQENELKKHNGVLLYLQGVPIVVATKDGNTDKLKNTLTGKNVTLTEIRNKVWQRK